MCPLVSYKLAALRTFRKKSDCYKRMRSAVRTMVPECKEVTFESVKADLLKTVEYHKLWRRECEPPLSKEDEMSMLEMDYYVTLAESEKSFKRKSTCEMLSYMPTSERIATRSRGTLSSSCNSNLDEVSMDQGVLLDGSSSEGSSCHSLKDASRLLCYSHTVSDCSTSNTFSSECESHVSTFSTSSDSGISDIELILETDNKIYASMDKLVSDFKSDERSSCSPSIEEFIEHCLFAWKNSEVHDKREYKIEHCNLLGNISKVIVNGYLDSCYYNAFKIVENSIISTVLKEFVLKPDLTCCILDVILSLKTDKVDEILHTITGCVTSDLKRADVIAILLNALDFEANTDNQNVLSRNLFWVDMSLLTFKLSLPMDNLSVVVERENKSICENRLKSHRFESILELIPMLDLPNNGFGKVLRIEADTNCIETDTPYRTRVLSTDEKKKARIMHSEIYDYIKLKYRCTTSEQIVGIVHTLMQIMDLKMFDYLIENQDKIKCLLEESAVEIDLSANSLPKTSSKLFAACKLEKYMNDAVDMPHEVSPDYSQGGKLIAEVLASYRRQPYSMW